VDDDSALAATNPANRLSRKFGPLLDDRQEPEDLPNEARHLLTPTLRRGVSTLPLLKSALGAAGSRVTPPVTRPSTRLKRPSASTKTQTILTRRRRNGDLSKVHFFSVGTNVP
jgi:hypothetical protein